MQRLLRIAVFDSMKYSYSLLFLLAILFISCSDHAAKQEAPLSPIPTKSKAIEFQVDHRVETLYFIFLLTEYPLISRHESAYKIAAQKHFANYQNHQAVSFASALFERGFVADTPVNWLLQYSELPDLEQQYTVDFPFELVGISPDSTALFREYLLDFYAVAKCDSFIHSQQDFLDAMLQSVQQNMVRKDLINLIEDYVGTPKDARYTVVLSPLLHQGGFAIERTGDAALFALVGPNGLQNELPHFDHVFLEQDLVIHEFSHNYTNAVVDAFLDQTQDLEKAIFHTVKADAAEQGYDSWEAYLYELLVRSTTLRIVEKNYGPDAAQELLDYEKSVGFGHCTVVLEALKSYEANREQFPTLQHFFPEIIAALEADLLTESGI